MPYKDPEKRRKYQSEYGKKKTAEGFWRGYYRENRVRRKLEVRKNHLLKSYGLTLDQYVELVRCQNGLCAICLRPETDLYPDGTPKSLSVDHDHETGIVRGLLCRSCNVGIGNLRDDPELIRRAFEYLAKSEQRGPLFF